MTLLERPILFSGEMVRAILAGRKTQTRRVVKRLSCSPEGIVGFQRSASPDHWIEMLRLEDSLRGIKTHFNGSSHRCPYGTVGSRLWVRETWAEYHECSEADFEQNAAAWDSFASGRKDIVSAAEQIATPSGPLRAMYRADFDCECDWKWEPSIHMPRWASRLTLEIESVRVERIQEISPADCLAEGIEVSANSGEGDWTALQRFRELWDEINDKPKYVKGAGFGGETARFDSGNSWAENPWVWCLTFKVLKDAEEVANELR